MSSPKERKHALVPSKSSLSLETEYYVYVLCDPRKPGSYNYTLPNGKTATFANYPFYVGKGKGSRSKAHIREALKNKSGGNLYKIRTIQKIFREGQEVDIRVCKPRFNEETAYEYEKMLIATIGRYDLKTGPLTNLTGGGDGFIKLSRKSIKKRSAKYKKWWAALSDKEKQEFSNGKRLDSTSYWHSLTEEEREGALENHATKVRIWWDSLPEEERLLHTNKQSEGQLRRYTKITQEERKAVAAKTQATIAKKSDKEKAKTTKRKSKSAKSWYNNLTEEQKVEMKAKQDAAKANYPLRTCLHCGHQGKGGNMTRYHFNNCKYK